MTVHRKSLAIADLIVTVTHNDGALTTNVLIESPPDPAPLLYATIHTPTIIQYETEED